MYLIGEKKMTNKEIEKIDEKAAENLKERFIIEVFDEKAADVSYNITPSETTLDDAICEAWREWFELVRNGHKKEYCYISVSKQIIKETEMGPQFFDYENCDNKEISEYARSFNEENESLYYISTSAGQEMDELREYVRSWEKGEPLDDIDISKMGEDDFLGLLYQKNLIGLEIIDSYKKWVR